MPFPERLSAGYASFMRGQFDRERGRYENLAARGQKPEIMVVGCCDSRVAPEAVFDAVPGELFVTRNVANLVPPYRPDGEPQGASAALEYAAKVLRVKHIVVLGHSRCGGVGAFANGKASHQSGDLIGKWLSMIAPAAETVPEERRKSPDYQRRLELASVENSLRNLMTYPCVTMLVESGWLQLHGAYFDISNGGLLVRDAQTGRFEPVCEAAGGGRGLLRCD